ncbi:MAG TPA: polysaccharide deacetylase family protein [Bacilli bacterium]|nr:polysaccharide deacetylase family protein [Bacilli bacterium]
MKKILLRTGLILLLVVALLFGLYKLMNARTYQVFGELVPRVETQDKVVALTFDDGPTERVDEVLPVLDELGVKATFFLIGNELEQHPEEGKKIAAAGHEIGNHTYSHQRMVFKSPSYIKEEIEKTDRLIRDTGYGGEILFRPPNCKKLVGLPYYLWQHDRVAVTWDVEPESAPEETDDPQEMVRRVKEQTKPGSIILFHVMYDSRDASRQALRDSIVALQEEGYRFVTVSELMKAGE